MPVTHEEGFQPIAHGGSSRMHPACSAQRTPPPKALAPAERPWIGDKTQGTHQDVAKSRTKEEPGRSELYPDHPEPRSRSYFFLSAAIRSLIIPSIAAKRVLSAANECREISSWLSDNCPRSIGAV